MNELATYYARAKEALPQAVAIGIISGMQTQDTVATDAAPLEWWTLMVYSTPIGTGSVVTAHVDGGTFDEALAKAVKGLGEVGK